MEKEKFAGILLVGWVYIIEGLIAIVSLYFIFRTQGFYFLHHYSSIRIQGHYSPSSSWSLAENVSDYQRIINYLSGIAGFVGGIGLLKSFSWSRKLLIVVGVIYLALLLSGPLFAMIIDKNFRFLYFFQHYYVLGFLLYSFVPASIILLVLR